jgi:hypothetical protein
MIQDKPPTYPLARAGAGRSPPRRPGSVRRTTTIESNWPDGFGGNTEMVGRARDIATPTAGGAPAVLAEGSFKISSSPRREIMAITTDPFHSHTPEMVGVRAGGASRDALDHALGDIVGSPLYQLIDDFAGASLVAMWIWTHWHGDFPPRDRERGGRGPTVNVCTGFAEGSSALQLIMDTASRAAHSSVEVTPLVNPADPQGWHQMLEPGPGPNSRRARRIDVWTEGDLLQIDAGFQDSGLTPEGKRVAIHEYHVRAEADLDTLTLRKLEAKPLILPFAECPGAVLKASKMIGQPLGEFRRRVLDTLPHTEGCTHLNDVMRALSDAPKLAERTLA